MKFLAKHKFVLVVLIALLLIVLIVCTALLTVFLEKRKGYAQWTDGAASKVSYKVLQSFEYLGTAERTLPEVSDGGLERYPVYGTALSGATTEEKEAILAENYTLVVSSSTYDSMDAQGNLYLGGVATGAKLYKHTAAAGMYNGDVDDDEPAIVKKVTLKARSSGYHVTGVYAPAGEVVKITMSEEDLAACGGLTVIIGQAFPNGVGNIISTSRDFVRMPVINNNFTVNSTEAYVGSYLGGPVYIAPVNRGVQFSVTISGGVAYPYIIMGQTTEEEYNMNALSSAPYFDLEIWDNGVRHSGARSAVADYDYGQLCDAGEMWHKFCLVSNEVPSAATSVIVFLYDPYIYVSGAAGVAMVGRNDVVAPISWLTASMNYEGYSENGNWGTIHEFNHHHQKFGTYDTTEVTNNAINLLEYSLFTNISAARTTAADSGISSWWNKFTVPNWVLTRTLSTAGGDANTAVDGYANLLYSFGQDAFIRATQLGGGKTGTDVWYNAVCEATGYDMTYYFCDILNLEVSEEALAAAAEKNYPMYVPVASVYETGTAYTYNGSEVHTDTVRPFKIPAGADYEIDLNSYIVLPDGFSYSVREVSSPEHGTITKKSEGVYVYSPDENTLSGEIVVTLRITKDDGAFGVEDVKLILGFQQSDRNENVIERTVYTYDAGSLYSSAQEAYESGYAGYTEKTEEDNVNSTQNGNFEMWVPSTVNSVMELSGKVYVPSDGKYRFIVRGRTSVCFYYSTDGVKYTLGGTLTNTAGDAKFHEEEEDSYCDLELEKGAYIYIKAVVVVNKSNSYVGMGWGKFSDDGSVSVTYITDAYRNSAYKTVFTSEYFYYPEYTAGYSSESDVGQTCISYLYSPWDDSFPIDNLFDDDYTNYIHSDKTDISGDNPFEITVELGSAITANCLTIYGEPSRLYLPTSFRLYAGSDVGSLTLVADVTGAAVKNSNVQITFETTTFKYYKLVVTDTSSAKAVKYIAFRRCAFSAVYDGKLYAPSDGIFVYYGNWERVSVFSTFGYAYSTDGGKMSFTFTGTQFALFGSGTAAVYIDGKKAGEYTAGEDGLLYLSEILSDGGHTITVEGTFLLDSAGMS